jgi:predicted unusual protein kinase regulating ubiquinone biosynthesis (AarF/ABC1/UbiB family)
MATKRTRYSVVSSRRKTKSKSVMAFPCLLCFVMVSISMRIVVVVESMVSTTIPKPASRSRSRSDSDSGVFGENYNDSDDILRRLLKDQGKKNRYQYQYQGKSPSSNGPMATTNGATTTSTTSTTSTTTTKQRTSPHLDEWRDYEALRQTNLEDEALGPFFFESGFERQQVIASRFFQVATTVYKARDDWTESQNEKKAAVEAETDEEVSLTAPDTDDPAALRLCDAVASLGPLAVKLGQTLSQRPDIVGKDACNALKRLQTQNTPFDDDLAHAVLRESLDYWDGPLAANLVVVPDDETDESENNGDGDTKKKPLFQILSKGPIASASLGQVYKATTWEGVDIALKVQRPDALKVIAIDVQCFRIASNFRNTVIDWSEKWNVLVGNNQDTSTKQEDQQEHTPETGMTEEEVRSRGDEGTVASVIDRVARDIKREMDYTVEASNSYKFRDSLSFLGFVDTPDVLLATDKILATRFVNGHHLANLNNPKDELALARMAVEACTASMVLTGFVHADPHEGNLMFREDDGKIVFLDFGLMSDVDQDIMEAFARGIQALLSEDFVSLTEAWSDSGFVTNPIMHRDSTEDLWRVDPNYGKEEFAIDLEHHMKTTEGGLSRFGALATVLNKKISPNWLVFTPPYVLLLIRTFLTLEGIAGA